MSEEIFIDYSEFQSYRKRKDELIERIRSGPKDDEGIVTVWIDLPLERPYVRALVRYSADDSIEADIVVSVTGRRYLTEHSLEYKDFLMLDRLLGGDAIREEMYVDENVEDYSYVMGSDSIRDAVDELFSMADSIEMFVQSRSLLKQQGASRIEKALEETRKGDSGNALIQADQGLELMLRGACLSFAKNPEEMLNKKGEKFEKWRFSDYIEYLREKGGISAESVVDIFTIHNWRNNVQHSGIKPEREQVRQVVERIKTLSEALP